MNVVSALRRFLLSQPTIERQVGDRVWKNQLDQAGDVFGGGRRALVVRSGGTWQFGAGYGGVRFPLLIVDCYADCSRDPEGNSVADDAADNALAVWAVVDGYLNSADRRRGYRWGDLAVSFCQRHAEPDLTVPDDLPGAVDGGPALARGIWAAEVVPSGNAPSF